MAVTGARTSGASRRLGRPPSSSSLQTRKRILDAARYVFGANGYDAATNKEIAETAGITTGAIYHYFGSKRDLYVAVFDEVQEIVYGSFKFSVIGRDTLVERLEAVLDMAVELNRRDSSITAFVVGVAGEARRHPQLGRLVGAQLADSSDFFRGLVLDAASAGELPDDMAPETVVAMVVALTNGLARFSHLVSPDRHAATVDAFKALLRHRLTRAR
jgi:AcrR family transcriptional regulator